MLDFLKGFRRYVVTGIACASGVYSAAQIPLQPGEWEPIVQSIAAAVAAILNLWSAFRPATAAGTK